MGERFTNRYAHRRQRPAALQQHVCVHFAMPDEVGRSFCSECACPAFYTATIVRDVPCRNIHQIHLFC